MNGYWSRVNEEESESEVMLSAPDDLEAFFTLQEHMWDWVPLPTQRPVPWWKRLLQYLGFHG
jgi:hypothetical protein